MIMSVFVTSSAWQISLETRITGLWTKSCAERDLIYQQEWNASRNSIPTALRVGWSGDWTAAAVRDFFFFSKTCSLLYKGYRVTFPGYSDRAVKLTSHLHLMSRLRMSGVDRHCFYTLLGLDCFIPLFTSAVFGWDYWSLKMLSLGNSIIQKRGNRRLYWSSREVKFGPRSFVVRNSLGLTYCFTK